MTEPIQGVELWMNPTAPEPERLFYRHWPARTPSDRALLLFHRGHEHSGRLTELVRDLDLPDVHCFAWDARGHGRSPGERGDAPSAGAMIGDVERFVAWIAGTHAIARENMAVLAHSVGAAVVAAWVHDFAPAIRALVLATPALRVRLYVPLAVPLLRLKQRLLGPGWVKSYVKAGMLTHDPAQAAAYRSDPLIFRQISVRVLLGLHDASTRVIADSGAIRVPTLLLSAGSDWVVDNAAQARFFQGLGGRRRWELFPGLFHAIFHERDRAQPIAVAREFLREAFTRPYQTPDLLDAHRYGYTKEEHGRLSRPLPWLSPRGLGFRMQRLLLRTVGRLSEGIRLGWRTGFDSGATLDYVYENRARGATWLGRKIDRGYLDAVGWRGIRTRREHLQRALVHALTALHARKEPLHVLDIAAGHGRYVLEAMRMAMERLGAPVTATLRDLSPANVAAGTQLAEQLGVRGVTFVAGDAFDQEALAATSPRPTVAVVSGLYELFSDNDRVLASLRGLAAAVPPGGFLVYTNQPWHPQLEWIARVLDNREGRPWVMRRRTQAEMDQLVRSVGFVRQELWIDEDGIFTVSLAERTR